MHEALSGHPVDHRGVERVVASNSLPHHRNRTNSGLSKLGVSCLGCRHERRGTLNYLRVKRLFSSRTGFCEGSIQLTIFRNIRFIYVLHFFSTHVVNFLCDLYTKSCTFAFTFFLKTFFLWYIATLYVYDAIYNKKF